MSDRFIASAHSDNADAHVPPHESTGSAVDLINVGMALRDFCLNQLLHIDVALGRHGHPHRGVHEARKAIRRLRSVLALGTPCFGAAALKVDRSLQRLGRSLSTLRDAHVAVELARRRAKRSADTGARATWRYAAAALVHVRTRVLHRALRDDAEFAHRRAALARCARKVMALPWRRIDTATLSKQLARSRQRADRAAARVDEASGVSRLHRLRKRLRRHRMQVTALTAILNPQASTPVHAAPGFRASVTAYAHTLGELSARVDALGARLDTRMLQHALRCLPAGRERKAALSSLKRGDDEVRRGDAMHTAGARALPPARQQALH